MAAVVDCPPVRLFLDETKAAASEGEIGVELLGVSSFWGGVGVVWLQAGGLAVEIHPSLDKVCLFVC